MFPVAFLMIWFVSSLRFQIDPGNLCLNQHQLHYFVPDNCEEIHSYLPGKSKMSVLEVSGESISIFSNFHSLNLQGQHSILNSIEWTLCLIWNSIWYYNCENANFLQCCLFSELFMLILFTASICICITPP